jgi:hypothetical protein
MSLKETFHFSIDNGLIVDFRFIGNYERTILFSEELDFTYRKITPVSNSGQQTTSKTITYETLFAAGTSGTVWS